MSNNAVSDDMIDAILAGLPKVDGDNDVAMTSPPPALPVTDTGKDESLEPGQIPPWEDKMDVQSTTQAAKPVDDKSTPTPTPAGVSATPKQPSAQAGQTVSTAVSVSSTPSSNRTRPLRRFTPRGRFQGNVSGIFSFNGSPGGRSGRSFSGPVMRRPTGPLPFRPGVGVTPSARGPNAQASSGQGQGPGPKVPSTISENRGGMSGGSNQGPPAPLVRTYPACGQPNVAPPTELLSKECQRRHFNPEWRVYTRNSGPMPWACDVKLGNTWVIGKTSHRHSISAKMAMAREALEVVKKMPVVPKTVSLCNTVDPISSQTDNQPAIKQEHDDGVHRFPVPPNPRPTSTVPKRDDNVAMRDAPRKPIFSQALPIFSQAFHRAQEQDRQRASENTRVGETNNSPTTVVVARRENNPGDDASLEALIRRSAGITMPTSTNPEVQRAFLEGIALGSRLGASLEGLPRVRQRSRSRSPVAGRRDRYRARSPQGSRVRLTAPQPYYQYPGRHAPSYYRPIESASQRERERQRAVVTQHPTSSTAATKTGANGESQRTVVTQHPTSSTAATKTGVNSESWGHDGYFSQNKIKIEKQD